MSTVPPAAAKFGWALDAQHGPLPPVLLVLTTVTGLIDAASYLALGRVFVANMTGNIVFLGFAAADTRNFSIPASATATLLFLLGALAGGWLAFRLAHHRGRFLAVVVYLEIALTTAALALCALLGAGAQAQYPLIALLAAAMGLQNAAARRLGVPDLTTTVLTLTLTGLAADSHLAGGASPHLGRRLLATFLMFLGGAAGALLVLRVDLAADLAAALALLVAIGVVCPRLASSNAEWTKDVVKTNR
jgi:uncharacterized membrane protein YoaK (UPF0700 family)